MAWPSEGTLSTLLEQLGRQWLQLRPQFSSGSGSNSSGYSFARRDAVPSLRFNSSRHPVTLCLAAALIGEGVRTGAEQTAFARRISNAPRKFRRRGPALAFLLLRLTLGLNICMHGASRLAAGPAAFANSLVPMFQNTALPAWSVHIFGLILPWAEAILGFLLLIGFCTWFALVCGALLILVLTFGTTLHQDWSTAGVQLIYAAVYAALLALARWNDYSLDRLLSLRHPSMVFFVK
jgi:thiosulfate dehydrogenase [quinone] large subunit